MTNYMQAWRVLLGPPEGSCHPTHNSAYSVIFHAFYRLLIYQLFSKQSLNNTIRVSNDLNPDQARRFVISSLQPTSSILAKA